MIGARHALHKTLSTRSWVSPWPVMSDAATPRVAALKQALSRARYRLALAAMLVGAIALHTYSLNHAVITQWDESFHAVVAQHVALHPLLPTLYEVAALTPAASRDWGNMHVWLHIPIFGFWVAGLSLRLFGNTLFALRLPGVLYIGLGMVTVYEIGRRLYGPIAGLVAAAFIGFAPYVVFESQGYVFGDLTDMPLLFFTPLAVLCLIRAYRSGRWRWLILAGVAAGICYLTKAALGWAPIAVAGACYLFELIFPAEAGWRRLGLRGFLLFMSTALAVVAPYNVYTALAFPQPASVERANWLKAFTTNFETWGRPVDTHMTAYLYGMYGPALALLILISVITLAVVGIRRRSRVELIPVVWMLALYVPLTMAVSKAPAFTFAALPAIGLAVARFGQYAGSLRSVLFRMGALSVLFGAAVCAAVMLFVPLRAVDPAYLHWPYPQWWPYADWWPKTFVLVPEDVGARLTPLVLDASVAAVLFMATILLWSILSARVWRQPAWPKPGTSSASQRVSPVSAAFLAGESAPRATPKRPSGALAMLLAVTILGAYWLSFDASVVRDTPIDPGDLPALGAQLARVTPTNATVILNNDLVWHDDVQMLMFWARRDIYSYPIVSAGEMCSLANAAAAVDSPLFVVSTHPTPGTDYLTFRNWAIFAPNCPQAGYIMVLRQLRRLGIATAQPPGSSAVDFGAELSWRGADPQNDVRQIPRTAWGVNVAAMLLHPYYPENPPAVATRVSVTLPASWSGRRLLFLSTIAPWAADHPEAHGVRIVFDLGNQPDLGSQHYTQAFEVLNDRPHRWQVIELPLPSFVGTPTLTVTPQPRTSLAFDSTLFGFLGVVNA
jgi:4-amino-4-deoxy-L-arabinose transferase-like glycosyltransferase